ncbi:hypothetical protein BR93DRAFT_469463 [Coniochaeta sp. PMI_546]|nr:hypothetical protein BR93DRAFT_469463 [Coniochaeta sp. PMI_546]
MDSESKPGNTRNVVDNIPALCVPQKPPVPPNWVASILFGNYCRRHGSCRRTFESPDRSPWRIQPGMTMPWPQVYDPDSDMTTHTVTPSRIGKWNQQQGNAVMDEQPGQIRGQTKSRRRRSPSQQHSGIVWLDCAPFVALVATATHVSATGSDSNRRALFHGQTRRSRGSHLAQQELLALRMAHGSIFWLQLTWRLVRLSHESTPGQHTRCKPCSAAAPRLCTTAAASL